MLKTEHLQQRTPRELRRLFWIRLGLGCFHRARATVDGGEGATKAPQSEGVLLAISMNDNAAEVSPLDSFEREATRLCDVKKERVGTMDLGEILTKKFRLNKESWGKDRRSRDVNHEYPVFEFLS